MRANQFQNIAKKRKNKVVETVEVYDFELRGKQVRFSLGKRLLFLLFLLIVCTFIIIFSSKRSFEKVVVYDSEGKPQLAPERCEKLREDTNAIKKCHQYSLKATKNGLYPCYLCEDTAYVFLLVGEIWKIGRHCPKDKLRYSKLWLERMKLEKIIEFEGTLQECLLEEKKKIYNYPLLPENLKRQNPLGHPAGNKNDN